MTEFFGGHTGWLLGYVIGLVVVLVVVALVVPILLLAWRIGRQAKSINSGLMDAETNTAGLKKLRTTIESATNIVAGLNRGRVKLGG
jgi:divalent metal cation (Fe/Co/Zn/Cd) transporter